MLICKLTRNPLRISDLELKNKMCRQAVTVFLLL